MPAIRRGADRGASADATRHGKCRHFDAEGKVLAALPKVDRTPRAKAAAAAPPTPASASAPAAANEPASEPNKADDKGGKPSK